MSNRDSELQEVVVALSRYVQQYEQRFQSAAVTVNDEMMTIRQRVSICEDEESVCKSSVAVDLVRRSVVTDQTENLIQFEDILYDSSSSALSNPFCSISPFSATSPSLELSRNKKLALKNTLLSPQSRLTSGNKFVETWKVCLLMSSC